MTGPYLLSDDPSGAFPPVDEALDERHGLLAISRDLHPMRILTAYRNGIFPWYNEGEPIAWYSPPVRLMLPTEGNPLGRRFRKGLADCDWMLTADRSFRDVMRQCAEVQRPGQSGGTWINADMRAAYDVLHEAGVAHSVEVRRPDGSLVGGLYGLFVRGMFCGDSMFSLNSGASKVAFAGLCRFLASRGIEWIDGQLPNAYLASLGGIEVPRDQFLSKLQESGDSALGRRQWSKAFGSVSAREFR